MALRRTLVRARIVQQQVDVPVVFQVVRQDDLFLQVKDRDTRAVKRDFGLVSLSLKFVVHGRSHGDEVWVSKKTMKFIILNCYKTSDATGVKRKRVREL